MSTRAMIKFQQAGRTEAMVYQHYDGDSIPEDLKAFFAEVKKQCPNDTRFDDPTYLAARFVVWKAQYYVESGKKHGFASGNPLDFLGIGIYLTDPGDLSFTWLVGCDSEELPTVKKGKVRP